MEMIMKSKEKNEMRKRLTYVEMKKIENVLVSVVTKEKDGYFRYKDAWTDEKVAAQVSPLITKPMVRKLRVELGFRMRRNSRTMIAKKPLSSFSVEKRISTLENALFSLTGTVENFSVLARSIAKDVEDLKKMWN